jgi:hypothetical protein
MIDNEQKIYTIPLKPLPALAFREIRFKSIDVIAFEGIYDCFFNYENRTKKISTNNPQSVKK